MTLINGFEITNLEQLGCEYQLLAVEGIALGDDYDKHLNRIAGKVTRQLKQPTALVKREGKPFLALPASSPLPDLQCALTPHVADLVPVDEKFSLRFDALDEVSTPIALRFLSWSLDSLLWREPLLWRDGLSYFEREPRREGDVQMFRGFRMRLLPVDTAVGRSILVCLDGSYKYTDALWLDERAATPEELRGYKMSHALYHFGTQWFRVQIINPTGESIEKQKFQPPGGPAANVYAYTKAHTKADGGHLPWIRNLDPKSPAILYRYPGKEDDRFGAAALCKLTYRLDHPDVGKLHRHSIVEPERRLRYIQEMVRPAFRDATLDGVPIRLSDKPFEAPRRFYRMPDLLFGDGQVLRIQHEGEAKIHAVEGERVARIEKLGAARLKMLSSRPGGFYHTEPLGTQFILSPQSLPRSVEDDFVKRFGETVSELFPGAYSPRRVVYDDRGPQSLQAQVAAIKAALDREKSTGGYVLLLLPPQAHDKLHNFIKREWWPRFQFQCANAANLCNFYRIEGEKNALRGQVREEKLRHYGSYLRNLAIGHLLVNRRWPCMPANPLHHDCYVGVDVLDNVAGFTFFDALARECYFFDFESTQKEKLAYKQMQGVFRDCLAEMSGASEWRSLVVLRDGRSYRGERRGVASAVRLLQEKDVLRADLQVATVEVHKRSATPMRLFTPTEGSVRNPDAGEAFAPNGNESFLSMTGFPFQVQGTVSPLHLIRVQGSLAMAHLEEDVFHQGMMAWSAPDLPSRLPMELALCDMFLRPIASESAQDEARWGADDGEDEDDSEDEGDA